VDLEGAWRVLVALVTPGLAPAGAPVLTLDTAGLHS